MKKKLTLALVVVLAFALGVGGTFAYLTAKTATVVNTFTVGQIDVDLYETGADGEPVTSKSYTVAPGQTAAKDPTIKVTAGDQAWVFIGVNNPNSDITFTVNDGWTQVGTYTVTTGEGEAATRTVYTVYGYDTKVAKDGTATLFDKVSFSSGIEVGAKFKDITLIGFGVQTEGFTSAQAAWDATFAA